MINNNKKDIGSKGEKLAAEFLVLHNYEIIATNFFSPYGEIDIIALKDEILVFIEVKTRSSNLDSALNSISISKRKKISRTAALFLAKNQEYEDMFTRFDVIAILLNKDHTFLKHIKEAFITTL